MPMTDLYRALSAADPNKANRVLTVTSGAAFGAKAFFSGGELVWESGEGFFSAHKNDLPVLPEIGSCLVAGQTIFCDSLQRDRKIVVCGGGHVGTAVLRLCVLLGYPVTLLEDRPEFAETARAEGAERVICAPFEEGLAQIEGDTDTFFVITTRGHQFDKTCLNAIALKKHAYIGLLGSRRRVAGLKQTLIAEGAPKDVIESVHSPIGLAIGAETPAEIAVSVLAEIIQVKSAMAVNSYPRELMHAIVNYHGGLSSGRMALSTIIRSEGSSPRGAGTKMLVREDGSTVGSVGGGRVEAEILAAARDLIAANDFHPRFIHVDMTKAVGPDSALLCGGEADLIVERIQ